LGMVLWPLGAIIGRYLRTYYPKWVRLHYIIMGAIATPVAIVVFALGRAHKQGDPDNWTTLHFRLGLVLLLLPILQSIYGTVLHMNRLNTPFDGPKSIVRYIHPIGGITILVLGFIQVRSGMGQWNAPGTVPRGIIIAFWVLVALWGTIYLAGFALLPRQWRARKANMSAVKRSDSYEVPDGERRSSVAPLTRPSVDTRA